MSSGNIELKQCSRKRSLFQVKSVFETKENNKIHIIKKFKEKLNRLLQQHRISSNVHSKSHYIVVERIKAIVAFGPYHL